MSVIKQFEPGVRSLGNSMPTRLVAAVLEWAISGILTKWSWPSIQKTILLMASGRHWRQCTRHGIYKNRIDRINPKKVDSLQKLQERVLELLRNTPGETRDAIASQLGVSTASVGQVLRNLEKLGNIHSHPYPFQNKTKLYYAASSAPATSTGATSSISKAVPDVRPKPPLNIYFVDLKTLQPLN